MISQKKTVRVFEYIWFGTCKRVNVIRMCEEQVVVEFVVAKSLYVQQMWTI